MNDYDDEIEDPHAIDTHAFASYSGGGLGDELLEAVSPDASFEQQTLGESSGLGGTPRKRRGSRPTRTTTTVASSLQAGDSLADELGGGGAATLGDELDSGRDTGEDGGELVVDEEEEEAKAAAQQSRYEAVSASLSESVRITQSFLEQLQSVSGKGIGSSSGSSGQAPTNGMTSSTSANSISSFGGRDPQTADERLELSGNQIVLNLRQAAKTRDGQVRELQEILRAMNRPDPAMQAAIAETWIDDEDENENEVQGTEKSRTASWLNPIESSEPFLGYGSSLQTSRTSSGMPLSSLDNVTNHNLGSLAEEEEDHEKGPGIHSPTRDDDDYDDSSRHLRPTSRDRSSSVIIPPGPSRKAPVSAHLSHLQAVTVSLLSSLGHLNESSQISEASFREATKQLRKLRNGLNDWRREIDLAERSQQWISDKDSSNNGGGSDALQPHLLAHKEMSLFEERYDECLSKARVLLSPVPSSIIDGAMDAFRDTVEAVTAGIVV